MNASTLSRGLAAICLLCLAPCAISANTIQTFNFDTTHRSMGDSILTTYRLNLQPADAPLLYVKSTFTGSFTVDAMIWGNPNAIFAKDGLFYPLIPASFDFLGVGIPSVGVRINADPFPLEMDDKVAFTETFQINQTSLVTNPVHLSKFSKGTPVELQMIHQVLPNWFGGLNESARFSLSIEYVYSTSDRGWTFGILAPALGLLLISHRRSIRKRPGV